MYSSYEKAYEKYMATRGQTGAKLSANDYEKAALALDEKAYEEAAGARVVAKDQGQSTPLESDGSEFGNVDECSKSSIRRAVERVFDAGGGLESSTCAEEDQACLSAVDKEVCAILAIVDCQIMRAVRSFRDNMPFWLRHKLWQLEPEAAEAEVEQAEPESAKAYEKAYSMELSAKAAESGAELFPLRTLDGDLVELHVHFPGGHSTVVGRVQVFLGESLWVGPCRLKPTALVRRDSVGPGFVFDCKEQDV